MRAPIVIDIGPSRSYELLRVLQPVVQYVIEFV
jgi:hypothetical protein